MNLEGSPAIKQEFHDSATAGDLFDKIEEKFSLHGGQVELRTGFPPVLIKTVSRKETLESCGISTGSVVNIRRNAARELLYNKLFNMGYPHSTCTSALSIVSDYADLSLAVEICNNMADDQPEAAAGTSAGSVANKESSTPRSRKACRHKVDADNSCLFNALKFCMDHFAAYSGTHSYKTAADYRRAVADVIQRDPFVYTADFLGKEPEVYREWILHPDHWGGEIEMSILSGVLGVEIAAIDIQSNNSFIYGEGSGVLEGRIYVIYDGIHFDALAMEMTPTTEGDSRDYHAAAIGGDEAKKITVFSPEDQAALLSFKELAAELKRKKQFVNLADCAFQCNICYVGLRGQEDAREHAKATGHTNFRQTDT